MENSELLGQAMGRNEPLENGEEKKKMNLNDPAQGYLKSSRKLSLQKAENTSSPNQGDI